MMRALNNKVFAYIPLYVLDYPLFVFGVLLFFTSFSLKTFFLILVFWAASSSIQGLITHLYNFRLYFNFFYLYILRFRNCTFERYRVEDFLSNEFVNELLIERLGIGLSNKPLGYVTVIKRKRGSTEKQFPGAMTTFPIETEPWYIMVSDKREDLFDYQWFVLLHELGHTMVHHKIPLERSVNLPFQILFFEITLLLICPFSLEISFLITGLSLFSCYQFATYKTPEINYEIIADTFSLLIIDTNILEKVAKEHIEKLNSEVIESKYNKEVVLDVEYRKKNVTDVLQYRLTLKSKEDIQNAIRKFNISAKAILWVKWYYYLPILATVIIGLYHSPKITWNTVLIGFSISIFCFVISLFIIYFYRRFLKDRIDTVMNQGEVTPDLYSEHFIQAESILHRKHKKHGNNRMPPPNQTQ